MKPIQLKADLGEKVKILETNEIGWGTNGKIYRLYEPAYEILINGKTKSIRYSGDDFEKL